MSFAKMSSNDKPAVTPRRTGGRFIAVIIALAALALVAAVWLWTSLLAVSVPLFGWQNGVIFGGSGVFCLALLAALRVGFEDLLDWIWAIVAAVMTVIVSIFWGIMALFGWD